MVDFWLFVLNAFVLLSFVNVRLWIAMFVYFSPLLKMRENWPVSPYTYHQCQFKAFKPLIWTKCINLPFIQFNLSYIWLAIVPQYIHFFKRKFGVILDFCKNNMQVLIYLSLSFLQILIFYITIVQLPKTVNIDTVLLTNLQTLLGLRQLSKECLFFPGSASNLGSHVHLVVLTSSLSVL